MPSDSHAITRIEAQNAYKDGPCTCNITWLRVRMLFIPPRLSWQPDDISLEDSNFYCSWMSPTTIKPT